MVGVVLAAVALAVPASAVAAAETEPNDRLYQANQLSGNDPVSGALANSTDQDTFLFSISQQSQVDITFAGCATATVRDVDNVTPVAPPQTSTGSADVKHLLFTASPATSPASGPTLSYVLTVSHGDCDTADYTLQIASPGAEVSNGHVQFGDWSFAPDTHSPDQVWDPLMAGSGYIGSIDSVRDANYLTFFTQPVGGDLDVLATATSPCGLITVTVTRVGGPAADGDGGQFSVGLDVVKHLRFRSPSPAAQYLVQVTGDCAGQTYQVQVDYGGLLASGLPVTLTPPPDKPKLTDCEQAGRTLRAAHKRLARARAKWRLAVPGPDKRRARRVLRRAARTFAVAQRRVFRVC
jgi:hypothetical protein